MKKLTSITLFSLLFTLCAIFLTGCFSATQSTMTEFREDGSVAKVTQSSESIIKNLTESTKYKTVIAWESGWMAYISMSTATAEDPTPTVKLFAGKSDKGMISALPNQKNWNGIANAIIATKQDLSVTTSGVTSATADIDSAESPESTIDAKASIE